MWLSSMCSMSSARLGKCSPQPPKRQALEKKEAAAMPVIMVRAWGSGRRQRGSGQRWRHRGWQPVLEEEAEEEGCGGRRRRPDTGEEEQGSHSWDTTGGGGGGSQLA